VLTESSLVKIIQQCCENAEMTEPWADSVLAAIGNNAYYVYHVSAIVCYLYSGFLVDRRNLSSIIDNTDLHAFRTNIAQF